MKDAEPTADYIMETLNAYQICRVSVGYMVLPYVAFSLLFSCKTSDCVAPCFRPLGYMGVT